MRYIQESGITEKASRETGALTFFPEGRTYSPPTKSVVKLPKADVRSTRLQMKFERKLIAYRHIPS